MHILYSLAHDMQNNSGFVPEEYTADTPTEANTESVTKDTESGSGIKRAHESSGKEVPAHIKEREASKLYIENTKFDS